MMKTLREFLARHKLAPVYVHGLIYLAVCFVLRLVLWLRFGIAADVGAGNLTWILPVGLLNDIIQAAYLSVPLALYLYFLPERWRQKRSAQAILFLGSVITLAALFFISATEYFFFEEFDARFNLVAFDYLMYPTEVIGDVRAEYPVGIVAAAAVTAAVLICWWTRRYFFTGATAADALPRSPRSHVLVHAVIVVLAVVLIDANSIGSAASAALSRMGNPPNRVATELVANGMTSFWRAARTSEIDYHAFYVTHDAGKNWRLLHQYLTRPTSKLVADQPGSTTRHVPADPNGLGKMNVVVVVEESLGSEFSTLFGGDKDLTPHLDAYAQRSMWFRHLYASGTRTVRGLEAITASFPPIPSVSILRRPNNEHIATWGSVMAEHGYHTSFLYGGYGYFDNMNYFYGNNGFEVLDRSSIDHVRFENIWGVSDEDLFDRALQHFDERAATGRPFFSIIMSTSNHKPYTFREGVPGVPVEHGGRPAGVRYADFALGYFLDNAARHSWFENTLFVVVADHGARVYGKAEIPLHSYRIPMFIFSPSRIAPREVDTLTGQIDIAPTVLGLLGLEYSAPFYGEDILKCVGCDHVLVFNHNYDVATFRNGALAILGLGDRAQTIGYDLQSDTYQPHAEDRGQLDLTVAIYQSAFEQFEARRYR